jgi:D-aminopeptidase
MSNGSGDFVIAFSTRNPNPYAPTESERQVTVLENDAMSPLFLAAVEAVEEAVHNSLLRATTVTGVEGRSVEAISPEALRELLR